ncbi:MAG: DNA primase [Candidatus Omnitrophica bacterium]|nr:DNA primase [Candidatus Omnitrophota bacterium]
MPRIPEDIIHQVTERNDIVEVISQYFPLKKAGNNFKAPCPFHYEKTPSFIVNPQKQIFHCFGCGVGGNVISFVMKKDGLTFIESVRHLAERVNIVIPEEQASKELQHRKNFISEIFEINQRAVEFYKKNLLIDKSSESQAARDYLKKRKVALDTVRIFDIGYAPNSWDGLCQFLTKNGFAIEKIEKAGLAIRKNDGSGFYDRFRNRIIFPIYDIRSRCIAFGGRDLGDGSVKYLNSPETPVYTKGRHLYALNIVRDFIHDQNGLVVVEGYMDCIAPFQAGIKNIAASLGTALTTDQIRLIRRFTDKIIFLYDADSAGQNAMERSLELLLQEDMEVKIVQLADGMDPDSYVTNFGFQALQREIDQARSFFSFKLEILKKRYDLKVPEGKSNIAKSLLPLLNQISDDIKRNAYLKELSEAIGLPESVIAGQYVKMKQYPKDSDQTGIPLSQRSRLQDYQKIEMGMIRLMLEEKRYIEKTKELISVDDFQDKISRQLLEKIYEIFISGQTVNAVKLINIIEDQDIQQTISNLMANDELIVGNKEKMHNDYVNRIIKDRLKLKRKSLMQEIQRAEQSGDDEKLNELKLEFTKILKQNV